MERFTSKRLARAWKISGALLVLSPLLGVFTAAAFNYTNFNSTNGLGLVGSSAIVGGALRLTPAAAGQLGNAWRLDKQQCAGGFETRFQFRISATVNGGADGIVFVVQNSGPGTAGFLAPQGPGTNNTGVFFNTFWNWPGCADYQNCDFSANSIGIVSNNVYVAQVNLDPLGINLKDGAVHEGRIVFDGTGLTVWIDNLMVLNSIPAPSLKPGTDASGEGWVGFSSATGGAWENHDILNWSFSSSPASNCFTYSDFKLTNGLAFVGSSATVSGALRLTSAAQDQQGNAWLIEKQHCVGGFETRFQFRFSNQGSLPGTPSAGDGLVFAVQNMSPDAAGFFGTQGAGTNNISVFFNTFLNWPGCNDFPYCDLSANSVGVVSNDLYIAQANLDLIGINLKDGAIHNARILYDGTGLTVWLDDITVLSAVSTTLKPGTDASGKAWVGFGARTGWAWENHDVLNWSFCSGPGQSGLAPSITNQPQSQTVTTGASVQFTVGATGTPPLSYQWLFKGSPLPGQTTNSLTLTNVQVTSTGDYSVRVSNPIDSILSSNALLTVNPTITNSNCFNYADFASTTGLALVGSSTSLGGALRLTPAAPGQLGNAWRLDKQQCAGGFETRFQFRISAPVAGGADGIVFVVQNAGPGTAGFLAPQGPGTNNTGVFFNTFWNWPGCTDYQNCDFSANSIGIVSNNVYVAQVNLDPLGINLKDGAVHEARIVFDGSGLTVWIDNLMVLNSIPVPGLKPGTDASGQGWVGFSSATGGAWENHDILNWSFCSGQSGAPPRITNQPQSQTVNAGANVQFMVGATGTPPLTYQWLFKGTPLSGQTANSLTLANVQVTNTGNYSVRVSNPIDSIVSSNALLIVNPINAYSNCFSYADFGSTTGLALVGSSASVGGALRLTSTVQDQLGNAWRLDKQQCASGFDTRFQFRISAPGSLPGVPSGADGFVFAIQNLGTGAADFLSALGPATNYTSVFFNTFLNWPGCTDYQNCDFSANSIGIVTNNLYVTQVNLDPLGINLEDGAIHEGRIVFDGTGLTVWIDNLMVLGNVSIPGLKPGTDDSGEGWVGFGAKTGLAWENHDILNWSFCSSETTNAPGNIAPVPIISVSPLARFPGYTNLIVISRNNTNALVTFDGSRSYDVDDTVFHYAWLEGANLFSTNAVAIRNLALGTHVITLRLDDGFPLGISSASVTVEVISPAEAVAILIGLLDGSNLPQQTIRPLETMLSAAAAAFDRDNFKAGVNILVAFQNSVNAQVRPFNASLADQLISAANTIIDAAKSNQVNHRPRTIARPSPEDETPDTAQ